MRRSRRSQQSPPGPGVERARRWNLVAVAIASITGLAAALLPLGTSAIVDSSGQETSSQVSLLANEGAGLLIIVSIPALLVAIPLLMRGEIAVRRSRQVIVVLLGVLVLLGALSIGLFFVPTLIAMVMSVVAQTATPSVPTPAGPPKFAPPG